MATIKKTVMIHSIMNSIVRKTWAILIENGKDASYSLALNFMLLGFMLEAQKPEGLSKKTRELIWNFMEDRKTIDELNVQDLLITLEAKVKLDKSKAYVA